MSTETPSTDPVRPADDEACALARTLLADARHGALGVIGPEDGAPQVSRVAVARDPKGQPITLISTLSAHTAALQADPRCSLLLGEPGPRGDPLTHPRITLACDARLVPHGGDAYARLARHYLAQRPKSKLYIDFADFLFAVLRVRSAALNGGFGRAYRLSPADLGLPGDAEA